MSFTISYITNRVEPKFDWFFGGLNSQGGNDIPVNIVDFHAKSRIKEVRELAKKYNINLQKHVTPKPSVWQGEHRLTKDDYFAASNTSNTAIAICPTDWIVFVDDLSVFQPGWLQAVKKAVTRDGITCGAYRKVYKLEVEDGLVKSFENSPTGHDVRFAHCGANNVIPSHGGWFFGCSFVAPIENLLHINGFDEDCDGMGFQDCIAGIMLQNNGFKFYYDTSMMTWESEELHIQPGNKFIRIDPGVSPNDKSHAILNMVRNGRKMAPNYFDDGSLRNLRQATLNGRPFPIVKNPQHEWFTGKPLSEL